MAYFDALNELASVALAAVLNSFVVAALMVGCVGLAFRFAPRLNASTRHAIWWAVLLAVVIVAPVRTLVSMRAVSVEPVAAAVAVEGEVAASPATSSAVSAEISQASPLPITEPESLEVNGGYLPSFFMLFAGLILGAQFVRVLWSYRHLRELKRSAAPPSRELRLNFDEWVLACRVARPVRLLISDSITSPIAVGFRDPAVILPRDVVEHLPAADLEHMLLHELAHLARRDDWTNLLARMAWGLLAWHPVAAYVLRRIDDEREVACDDWVVCMTGQAQTYAVSLSRLVEFRLAQSREMLATGIGGRRSQLGDRIERLLQAGRRFDTRTSLARVGVTLAVLLTLVAAGAKAPEWVAFAQAEFPPVAPAAPAPLMAPVPHVPHVVHVAPTPHAIPAPHVPPAAPVLSFIVPPGHPHPVPEAEVAVLTPPAMVFRFPMTPAPAQVASAPPPPPPPAPARSGSGGSFLKALSDAGYRDLSVDEIIELRNHGITASYLAEMNQLGWGRLTVRQLADLRNHGVSPQTVRDIHALGFGKYSIQQMIDFTNHGVGPGMFRALKEAGFTNVEPREIIEARNHGLTAQNLQEAKKYGSQLTLRQIIRLKQAGVL